MILNTKTGALKLTKSEAATLNKAAFLLRLIEQHSPGKRWENSAGDAHSAIEQVLVDLGINQPMPEPAA